jgi:hypothetical protein
MIVVDEPLVARASYHDAAFPRVADRRLAFATGIVTMIG